MALKDGKYPAAWNTLSAPRKEAPNDPQLWFLLGYCARLQVKPNFP
jgi:hypothetical protein